MSTTRLVVLSVVIALACASEASDDAHYNSLSALVHKSSQVLNSVFLEEVNANLAVKNPMKVIQSTMQQMRTDIEKEKKNAVKRHTSTQTMCKSTLALYAGEISKHQASMAAAKASARKQYDKHDAKKHEPAQLNASRAARNVSCATKEVEITTLQTKRDKEHTEYLLLENAFEMALGNVTLIKRVMNGEGSMNDLAGQSGFIEDTTCSAHMQRLSSATSVPTVSSMLQVFSKSFSKLEKANGNDMDGLNTILDKVRENLSKALAAATKQENMLISQWQTEKLERREELNDMWIKTWKEFESQGEIEYKIGDHWSKEGSYKVKNKQARKKRDNYNILLDFLAVKCKHEFKVHTLTMAGYVNELNALSTALNYMAVNVFSNSTGWNLDAMDGAYQPYKWHIQKKPTYLPVSNSYSTIAGGYDGQSCRTAYEKGGYKTTFSKIRILQAKGTSQMFVDPNDLTYTKNTLLNNAAVKPICNLFPMGLPLGRAASCNVETGAKAVIDLRNTKYKFGDAAKQMFKVLGRKTSSSTVKLSHNGQKLELHAKGRCADVYGDDVGVNAADYRSDPIPLELAVLKAVGL